MCKMTFPNAVSTFMSSILDFFRGGSVDSGIDANASRPLRVAVIGAGLTGLLIGQGLKKRGFQVSIYDKEVYLGERTREWTVLLHWALPSLEKVLPEDVFRDLRFAYTDPFYAYTDKEELPFYNGMSGMVAIHTKPMGLRRFSRTRLRELLTRGLDIHWDKQFKDVEVPRIGPVTVLFADGHETTADLVIGCDGSRSAVRQWLFDGESGEVKPSDWLMCNSIINYGDAEISEHVRSAHPITTIAYLYDGLTFIAVQDVPDPHDPKTWGFHVARIFKGQIDQAKAGKEALRELQARTNQTVLCEPFRTSLLSIPEDTKSISIDQLHYWVSIPWDNRDGRITLAGDAAHSMLPSRGQGLNNALQCVNNLLAQLEKLGGGHSIRDALKVYEEEVIERGSKAVIGSLEDAVDLTKLEQLEKTRAYQRGLNR